MTHIQISPYEARICRSLLRYAGSGLTLEHVAARMCVDHARFLSVIGRLIRRLEVHGTNGLVRWWVVNQYDDEATAEFLVIRGFSSSKQSYPQGAAEPSVGKPTARTIRKLRQD